MVIVWLVAGLAILVSVVAGWLPLAWGFVGLACIVSAAWTSIETTDTANAAELQQRQRTIEEQLATLTARREPSRLPDRVADGR